MGEDGDRRGDSEAGAEADVDGDGSEEDAEEAAEDEGAGGELGAGFRGGDEGFEGGPGGCGCCHGASPACSSFGFSLDGSVSAEVRCASIGRRESVRLILKNL